MLCETYHSEARKRYPQARIRIVEWMIYRSRKNPDANDTISWSFTTSKVDDLKFAQSLPWKINGWNTIMEMDGMLMFRLLT